MAKSHLIKQLLFKFAVALTVLSTVGIVANLSFRESQWKLVWSEDFSGTVLDADRWMFEVGVGENGWGECTNAGKVVHHTLLILSGNNELQYYTANRTENVRLEGGHLVITAIAEAFNNSMRDFTSGRIRTKAAWKYGKVEIRAKMPAGRQLWPALWMMPLANKYGGWAASGEIDIAEYRGESRNQLSGTIHYGGKWPHNVHSGSGDKTFQSVDFSEGFHNFSVVWNKTAISWQVDGTTFHAENINRTMWCGKGDNPYTKNGQPFDQPFYILLNVAVGGNFFGSAPKVTPAEARANWTQPQLEVDFVKVFQWKR